MVHRSGRSCAVWIPGLGGLCRRRYCDYRFFRVVYNIMGTHPAVDNNVRRVGKHQLVTLFFLRQWRRMVIGPRSGIERHFAWMKRYFGLMYFQCYSLVWVTLFVC